MTTGNDAASTADTQVAPAKVDAKPELKSTDTGVLSNIRKGAETAAAQPKAEKPADKSPEPNAPPAGKGNDAASSEAEHQDDEAKLEPWMRKRLTRAEEKGRKQGRAEVLDEIKTVRTAVDPPAKPASESTPAPATQTPKTLADFDYDVEKFTQHQVREGVQAALAERDADNEKRASEAKAKEAQTAFEKRKAEFESRVGEGAWDELVRLKVDVPQRVVDLLMGHPKDLDIAHYLANHAEELDGLRGKSDFEIVRSLNAIESKLPGAGSSSEQELPPKTTRTPPPPPTVTGKPKSVKSITEMSTAERIAEWKRQKQQRQA